MPKPTTLNVVDQFAAELGRAIPQPCSGGAVRIFVKVETRIEQRHEFEYHLMRRLGLGVGTFPSVRQERHDPSGDAPRVRQIQGDLKIGTFLTTVRYRVHGRVETLTALRKTNGFIAMS